jgi:hypothetical protein
VRTKKKLKIKYEEERRRNTKKKKIKKLNEDKKMTDHLIKF